MCNIPAIDAVKTGERINKLRMAKKLSVRDLQGVFGFTTPQAIYKWQRGEALPSVDNLVVLARVFEVSIEEILVVSDA
ncbi:MAG: helix-turn-helix transcriptional regulator [Lachnospiraceae bacterium]|nr:helix-turn-helix transcriptional regulator [Lachnospiraceae bacterium]